MENWYTYFGTELLGSMLLIILGNGVVASVTLSGTKSYKNSNFLMIALGWGFAVAIGCIVSIALGGVAHLNPAVTFAFVANNWTQNIGVWGLLPIILVGQVLGFLIGQIIVNFVFYYQIKEYFKKTNSDFKTFANQKVLGMHATVPQNRSIWNNFLTEFIATAILIIVILSLNKWIINKTPEMAIAGAFAIMITLFAIGCSLANTGYAINPFRDLIPRIVYQITILLPFANNKETADWKYSWIPIAAPLSAGLIVGAFFLI